MCLQTLAMRPQLFAVPLFAASLWILAGRHAHPARLWALPVLAIVWANVHGSFVLAPLLVGLALVEDVIGRDPRRKRLALIAGLTAIATLVNPFGVGVWVYVKDLSTNPAIRDSITEWAPMSISTFSGIAFFVTAAVIAGWFARRARPIPWGALLWLGTFFALALPARRGVIWWALVAPVAVADARSRRASTDACLERGPCSPWVAGAQHRGPGGAAGPRARHAAVVATACGGIVAGRSPGGSGQNHGSVAGGFAPGRAATVGLLVRVRLAGHARLRRSPHRALPGRRLERLPTPCETPAPDGARSSIGTAWKGWWPIAGRGDRSSPSFVTMPGGTSPTRTARAWCSCGSTPPRTPPVATYSVAPTVTRPDWAARRIAAKRLPTPNLP